MSDINDLIHSNARVAFDQGVKTERNRILKALEDLEPPTACKCESCAIAHKFFTLIKGEQK